MAGAVALHLDDGVEHGADREALVGDLAHDAVHEERRVVLHDLQTVQLGADRRRDAELRRASPAPFGEAPEVRKVLGEIGRRKLRQLVRLRVLGGLSGERLDAGRREVVLEFVLKGLGQSRRGAGERLTIAPPRPERPGLSEGPGLSEE